MNVWDIIGQFYGQNAFTMSEKRCPEQLPNVKTLLANPRVFNQGEMVFNTSTSPSITPTRVVFEGQNILPFTVDQGISQQRFASQLEFFEGDDGNIEMRLSFVRQDKNVGAQDCFHLDQDFSGLKGELYADLSFDWFNYVILSIAQTTEDELALEAGLNAESVVRIIALPGQPTSPFEGLAFLWAEEKLSVLPFGGFILAPNAKQPEDKPRLDWASPMKPTGLEIGMQGFYAQATALLDPKKPDEPQGIGVALPMALGLRDGDLLRLKGVMTDPNGLMDLGVYNLPVSSFPTLDAFTKLANGNALGAIVPTQFPLNDKLVIKKLSATIGLNTETLISLMLAIEIQDLDWTLIPDLITLENLGAQFTFNTPLSQFSISPILYGSFELDTGSQDKAKFTATANLPDIPDGDSKDWTFGLMLNQPDPEKHADPEKHGPNLFALFNKLFNTQTFEMELFVDQLIFSVQPFKKTYTAQATIVPGSGFELPLGIQIKQLNGQFVRTENAVSASFVTSLKILSLPPDWSLTLKYASASGNTTWNIGMDMIGTLTVSELVSAVVPSSWHVSIPTDLDVRFLNLAADLSLPKKDFQFSGGISWQPEIVPLAIDAAFDLKANTPQGGGERQFSGQVLANITLLNLDFQAMYIFGPDAKQVSFAFQNIIATYTRKQIEGEPHKILNIRFGDSSIGAIIASLIKAADPGAKSRLSAPWNVLNDINLNGILIEVDFTSKLYKLQYRLDKNFAFITIDTIGIEYNKQYGKGKINFLVTGNFLGKQYTQDDPLTWDPVNEAPPPVPGAGKASFDVLYLGIGQHVAIKDARNFSSVDQVIKALASNSGPVENPGKNPVSQFPALEFSDASGWIIASRMLFNDFLTLDIVFNDPELYGLLITAGGPRAGNLKGLRFEILYQKISDDVGLWHINLVLPKIMRRLQMGAVTVVLPEITVDIYTNGDFKVDFGFPISLTDFSRCFSVEVFPFIGSGGFYFAKLSGDTSKGTVPQVSNGKFDPVVATGFALAVGLGKTIDIAVMSGGIYITVTGIVEGVFGQFNPDDSSKEVSTYISMKGTVAIVGRVYASVDFGIIKASVDLTAYAATTILYQSYQPIIVTLEAGVRVTASVKVLFVRIHFSFSATIREHFSLGSAQTPPWQLASDRAGLSSQYVVLQHHYLSPAQRHYLRSTLLRTLDKPALNHLQAQSKMTLSLWLSPVISQAKRSDFPGQGGEGLDKDEVIISVNLLAKVAAGSNSHAKDVLADPSLVDDECFEALMTRLMMYVFDLNGVGETVNVQQLEAVYQSLLDDSFIAQHFRQSALEQFFDNYATLKIVPRPQQNGDHAGVFFPVIPVLSLDGLGVYQIDFANQKKLDEQYIKNLKNYFAQLSVDYANELEREHSDQARGIRSEQTKCMRNPGDQSFVQWVFTHFFIAAARAAVHAAMDRLQGYRIALTQDPTSAWAKTLTLDPAKVSLQDIADYFPDIPMQYRWQAGNTLQTVATVLGVETSQIEIPKPYKDDPSKIPAGTLVTVNLKVTPEMIVESVQTKTDILRCWPKAQSPSDPEHPVLKNIRYTLRKDDIFGATSGDSGIAKRFDISLTSLFSENAFNTSIFKRGAHLVIGDCTHNLVQGETLQSVAAYYYQCGEDTGAINAAIETLVTNDPDVALRSGIELLTPQDERYTVQDGETLNGIARANNWPIAQLLLLNPVIALSWTSGSAIQLESLEYRFQDALIVVAHSYVTGDTPESLAADYFPYLDPDQQELKARLIKHWNPNIDWKARQQAVSLCIDNQAIPQPPQAGDVIRVPIDENLAGLAIYYFGSLDKLDQLMVNANTTNPDLLLAGSEMNIPSLTPEISEATSFAGLAQQYALDIAILTGSLKDVAGLFRDAGSKGPVELIIDHVPGQTVARLSEDLLNYKDLTNSAASLGRFMMHGLRMPAPGDGLFAKVMRGTECKDAIETYPMNVLLGQEFIVPETPPSNDIILSAPSSLTWLTLSDGGQGHSGAKLIQNAEDETQSLSMTLEQEELVQISAFRTEKLDISQIQVASLDVASVSAARQALTQRKTWAAGDIPQFILADTQSPRLSLWSLPESLQNKIADTPDKSAPFEAVLGRVVNGRLEGKILSNYAWATQIEIGVQRLTVADTGGPNHTYVLLGANHDGKARLLKLWDLMAKDGSNEHAELRIAYMSNPSSDENVLLSPLLDSGSTRILKTNLSNQSNPSTQMRSNEQCIESLLGDPTSEEPYWTEFNDTQATTILSMLWQNSVTRSGGFYLHYVDQESKGLPDYLFDHESKGRISLIVILSSQSSQNEAILYDFNNVLAVGESLDLSKAELYAQAKLTGLGEAFQEGAMQAYLNKKHWLEDLAKTPGRLKAGAEIRIAEDRVETVRVGDTLCNIWQRCDLEQSSMLASVSKLRTPSSIFNEHCWHPLTANLTQVDANVPQGTVGFTMTRPNPDQQSPSAQQSLHLQALFSLAGYQIGDNASFNSSYQGLPAGPSYTDDGMEQVYGLAGRSAEQHDSIWEYKKLLGANLIAKTNFALASPVLPEAKKNPYAGIGANSQAEIVVAIQDVMGNRTLEANDLPTVVADYGYLDDLKTLNQWAGIGSHYRIQGDGESAARLIMEFAFSAEKYLPSPNTSGQQAANSLAVAKQDAQRIYFQSHAPDLSTRVEISLGKIEAGPGAPSIDEFGLAVLRDLSRSSWNFFNSLSQAEPLTTTITQVTKVSAVATRFNTQTGRLFEANGSVPADSWFGSGASVNAPVFTTFKTDDSFELILKRLDDPGLKLAQFAEQNRALILRPETVVHRPDLSVELGSGEENSLSAIAKRYEAPILDTNGIQGFVSQNPKATIAKDQTVYLEGQSLTLNSDSTLDAIAITFKQDNHIEDASAQFLAKENPDVKYSDGQKLTLASYSLPSASTLSLVAQTLRQSVSEFAQANSTTTNLYTVGTALLVKVRQFALSEASPESSLSELAQLLDLSLNELGAWNADASLQSGATLSIPAFLDTEKVPYNTLCFIQDDSFSTALGTLISEADFLNLNQNIPGIFTPGITLKQGEHKTISSLESSFASLASELSMNVEDFYRAYGGQQGLPRVGASAFVPALISGETGVTNLQSAAGTLRVSLAELGDCNTASCATDKALLKTGQTVSYLCPDNNKTYQSTVEQWDSLSKLADRINQQVLSDKQSTLATAAVLAESNASLEFNPGVRLAPCVHAHSLRGDISLGLSGPIVPLTVNLLISRQNDWVHPSFRQVNKVLLAKTELSAAPFANSESSESLALSQFAQAFEQALPGLKLGTSDVSKVSDDPRVWAAGRTGLKQNGVQEENKKGQKSLWVVEISAGNSGQGFCYQAQWDETAYFALPPLTTVLWTPEDKISVQKYSSESGLEDVRKINVGATDVDAIALHFYETMDTILSPLAAENVLAFQLEDQSTYFDDLVSYKKILASHIKDRVQPVLTGTRVSDLDAAKETLHQQLLIELGAAGRVNTIVQTPFQIKSPVRDISKVARLFGQAKAHVFATEAGDLGVTLVGLGTALGVNAEFCAIVLQSMPNILNQGAEVAVVKGSTSHKITSDDTLESVASALGIRVRKLAGNEVKVTKDGQEVGILANNTALNLSMQQAVAKDFPFITNLATSLNSSIPSFMEANQSIANVFVEGSNITLGENQQQVAAPASIASVAQQFGKSMTEFAGAVAESDLKRRGANPSYSLDEATVYSYRVPPGYSFSTTKVPLAGGNEGATATQFATALFDAKAPATAGNIALQLAYRFTDLEFDIHSDPQKLGAYEESSWIKFILPLERPIPPIGSVEEATQKAIEIPVPLREYPGRANITGAKAQIAKNGGADQTSLNSSWSYEFEVTRAVAAQDLQTLKIKLNAPTREATSWASNRALYGSQEALFAALKAFEYAGDALFDDIALLNRSDLKGELLAHAKSATKAFHILAGNVVAALGVGLDFTPVAPPEFSMIMDVVFNPALDDPSVYNGLTLTKQSDKVRAFTSLTLKPDEFDQGFWRDASSVKRLSEAHRQTLCVRLDQFLRSLGRSLSSNIEFIATDSNLAIQRLIDHESGVVYRFECCDESMRVIAVTIDFIWPELYQWVTKDDDDAPTPVREQLRRTILGDVAIYSFVSDYRPSIANEQRLVFKFSPLDILNIQSATGTSKVTRNQPLIYGQKTNQAFVYETGENPFPSVTIPNLVDSTPLNLADFASGSLEQALAAFFEELTKVVRASSPDTSIPIALTGQYQFDLFGTGTDYTGLPLFLEPNKQFNVSEDWKPDSGSFINQVKSTADQRKAEAGVDPSLPSRYGFSLKLFSTLDESTSSQQLMEYKELYYYIDGPIRGQ